MLESDELATVADAFGVSEAQVLRDHFISHILVAVAASTSAVTFFGGTALARTHLADPSQGARLSEDIDLFTDLRGDIAGTLHTECVPTVESFAASAAQCLAIVRSALTETLGWDTNGDS